MKQNNKCQTLKVAKSYLCQAKWESFFSKKAFTLVELIIVIAIIAVLAVSAMMLLTKWLGKSRDSRRMADLKTIQTGLEVSYADVDVGNGYYPDISAQAGVVILYSGTDTNTLAYQGVVDTVVANIANMQKAPLDPSDNKEYTYLVTKNRKKFQLMAMLEDGTESTAFVSDAYALDYTNRYPRLEGYDIGIIIEESTNLPVHYISGLTGLDLTASLSGYIAYKDNSGTVLSGTEILLNLQEYIGNTTSTPNLLPISNFQSTCDNSESITYTEAQSNQTAIYNNINNYIGCNITEYPGGGSAIIAGQTVSSKVLVASASNDSTGQNIIYGYSAITTNATSTTDGRSNTLLLNSTSGTAGYICYNKGSTPGSWYLPAKDELNTLYTKLKVIGNFAESSYWSSTEISNTYAWVQDFWNGYQSATEGKSSNDWLRCASSF